MKFFCYFITNIISTLCIFPPFLHFFLRCIILLAMAWHKYLYLDYDKLRFDGKTHEQALSHLGIAERLFKASAQKDKNLARVYAHYEPEPITEPLNRGESDDEAKDIDLAYSALRKALRKVEKNPEGARVSEIVSLANAILDRRIGKPIQSSIVTGGLAHTYTLSDDDRDIIRAYTQAKAVPAIEGAGSTPCIPFREEKI